MATLASTEQDRAMIDAVLKELDRPAGVGVPDILFKEDHSGDEAVYITFLASRKLGHGSDRTRELTAFVQTVESALAIKGLSRFPYVWLGESR